MSKKEFISRLCDIADAIDSHAYFDLCEADNTEKEFVDGLMKIIIDFHSNL